MKMMRIEKKDLKKGKAGLQTTGNLTNKTTAVSVKFAQSKILIVFLLFTIVALPGQAVDFWVPDDSGAISHTWTGDEELVMCMQGRAVVMQVQLSTANDVSYRFQFFNVKDDFFKKLNYEAGRDLYPQLEINGQSFQWHPPEKATFDGMLTFTYSEKNGLQAIRTVYPSTDKPLIIEQWQLSNISDEPLEIAIDGVRRTIPGTFRKKIEQADIITEVIAPVVESTTIRPGQTLRFSQRIQCKQVSTGDVEFDLAVEYHNRRALAEAAYRGPGRLETPEPMLDLAFALQKFHVLESPINTYKGVITHNGSLRYSPGIWANDPVEYSSPIFPFFGNALLNEASLNMYRIWQDYCKENGIHPFPGSFEHPDLRLVQKHRGDNAMVLYALPKFLMFLGDREAAEELWPLVQFSAQSVEDHKIADGVIASRTDEMEGRYPTGSANLSTSALAYGGYCNAARLARSLGRKAEAQEFQKRADALAKAIEDYFGAEVEGYQTYEYFKGCEVLRGWILLPPAMDITERQDATLDAMLSDKLWPNRLKGGDILAASNRQTEWARETYYALRVLFKAGRTEKALETTRSVVKYQVFGNEGPYPDEDAIDMLCPGSLYPRIFTEGAFGIVPTGLDSFECTPWLPKDWPQMALRDMRAFGHSWDMIVQRVGKRQTVTICHRDGKIIFTGSGPAGKTYSVSFE